MEGTAMEGGYLVRKLDDVTSEADSGYRLSRHVAKKGKDGKYSGLAESLAVFLPVICDVSPFETEFPALNAAMQDAFDTCVDKYVRSHLEAGKTVIYNADLSLGAIDSFLASRPEGLGKLSGDKIREWFVESLESQLQEVITEKLGASVSDDKVRQTLNSYRDIFARLAEKSPSFEPKIHENLQKAIALAAESPMTEKLAARLLAASKKSVDLLAL